MGPWAFRLLTGGSVPWDPGGRGFRAVVERRRASGYVFGDRVSGAWPALPGFLVALALPGGPGPPGFCQTITFALCQRTPHSF